MELELARGDWLADDGIFTRDEITYCQRGKKPARRFAACFTAKEAALKAFNIPVRDLATFRDVEVISVGNTGYELVVHGRVKAQYNELSVTKVTLAIAGSSTYTTAMVILED